MSGPITSTGTPAPDPSSISGVSGKESAKHHKGHGASSADSTSSGGGKGAAHVDASKPVLDMDVDHMTSSQMYAMSIFWGEKDRKEREVAEQDQTKYTLTIGLKVGMIGPNTTSSVQISGQPGSQENAAPTVQNKSDPSGATTTTVTAQVGQGTATLTTTTDPATFVTQTTQIQTAETVISNTILDKLKRKSLNIPPLPNIDAARAALNAYIYRVITAANVHGIGPAETYLSLPGTTTSLNLNSNSVSAAEAVGFSEYVMGLVKSGDIQTFAEENIYPNDPKAAKTFAALMSSVLLDTSLQQAGGALGMQGYGQQVELQAKIVRDQNTLLQEPDAVKQLAQEVAVKNVLPGGPSENDLASRIEKTINSVMSTAPYLTRADLQQKLEESFQQEFSGDPTLAHNLALDVDQSSALLAAEQNGTLFSPAPFNQSDINVQSTQDSIMSAMQRDFAASDAAIRLSAKAEQKVHDLLQDVLNKQWNNEQNVRDAIKDQLLANFSNMTGAQADDIVASANFGIGHSGPLYDVNGNQVISPSSFNGLVQTGYQDSVHAAPSSPFGEAIDHVSGIKTGYDDTNMIGLINSSYYDIPDNQRSYLNLTPQQQIQLQNMRLYDPGAQLVMEAGKILNGGTEHTNAKKTIDVAA